jgi:hypothetical protein
MGAVYKARQIKLDRLVALKILPQEGGRDPAFAERFAREARAMAKLNHPRIVAVHDFGEEGGWYYLIMELVNGTNLRQPLRAGRLPPEEVLRIVPQVCEALQYAHDEGVIHRDIKPENILLDQKGQVKIADFGLAKLLESSALAGRLTRSEQVMGTPHYMAPEQMERPLEVDARADVYSLGVVVYEMLTGELPLGRFALPSQKAPVDGRFDSLVLRALQKEPAWRYQRISELKSDLESIAGGRPETAVMSTLQEEAAALDLEPLRQRVRRPALGLVIIGLLMMAFAVVDLIEIRRYDSSGRIQVSAIRVTIVTLSLTVLVAGIIVFAALKMKQLEFYGLAVISCVVLILPWILVWLLNDEVMLDKPPLVFVWVFSIAMGWWGLSVLLKPEVRAGFLAKRNRSRDGGRRY